MLADLIVLPTLNAFYFTLNTSTYEEAMAGCLLKGMELAQPNGTDSKTIFAPPGTSAWIGDFNGLASNLEGKKVAISIVPSIIKPSSIHSLPILMMESFTLPYICERKTLEPSMKPL